MKETWRWYGPQDPIPLDHVKQAGASGDDGTNDLLVSDVIRTTELQVWFVSQHLVDEPVVEADS